MLSAYYNTYRFICIEHRSVFDSILFIMYYIIILSLYDTIESLESRCEDLQNLVDDMGHLKKDDSVVSEGSGSGGAVIEDQDEYAKLASQLEHAKNQRVKEQRKVSELEQNVSLLIQVNTISL